MAKKSLKNGTKNADIKKFEQILDEINLSKNKNLFPAKESIQCEWCFMWNECATKVGNNPAIKLWVMN